MGKYGVKITLTEEAYEKLKKVKEKLGAKSWADLADKLYEYFIEGKRSA